MDFKKTLDGGVEKVIDTAADAAKKKIGGVLGGGEKKAQDAKPQGGIGDALTGAIGKAATDAAGKKAADEALAFGKSVLG